MVHVPMWMRTVIHEFAKRAMHGKIVNGGFSAVMEPVLIIEGA